MLVHQTDSQDDQSHPWTTGQYWDRMAGSLVNARVPYMFSTSAVGFVLNPRALGSMIRCSYPRDGNSMGAQQGCGDGAMWGLSELANMMRTHERTHHWYDACAWGAPSEQDRSGCQYNEIVLKGDEWRRQLPQLIEAVFYPANGHVDHREGDRNRAWQLHRSFLHAYRLSSDRCPLLKFDVRQAQSAHAPFSPG